MKRCGINPYQHDKHLSTLNASIYKSLQQRTNEYFPKRRSYPTFNGDGTVLLTSKAGSKMIQQAIPSHDFSHRKPLQFKMEQVGYVNDYNPSEAHRHKYFEIFLFEKGGGTHFIDFEDIPIEDRSIHFVSPGQVHQVKRTPGSHGYVLMFSEAFYYHQLENRDFLQRLPYFYLRSGPPVLALPPTGFSKTRALIQAMFEEFESRSAHKQSILQSYLNILLCRCKELFEQNIQHESGGIEPASRQVFRQFEMEVEKNFTRFHQVSDYARLLCITPRLLNTVVRQNAGLTPLQFLHNRLALEARRLLIYSSLNVNETGFELGFEDAAHFTKFVKKQLGRTPSELKDGR